MFYVNREAMIPCILLALGGNLVDGKLNVFVAIVSLYTYIKVCMVVVAFRPFSYTIKFVATWF